MSAPVVSMDVRHVGTSAGVIDIKGDVTAACEGTLMAAYEQVSKPGTQHIILNFTGLEYMNSSGIGMLVTMLVRANRQRQSMLAYGLTDHYQQIFQLTRLDEAITIHPDEAAALAAAGAA